MKALKRGSLRTTPLISDNIDAPMHASDVGLVWTGICILEPLGQQGDGDGAMGALYSEQCLCITTFNKKTLICLGFKLLVGLKGTPCVFGVNPVTKLQCSD